MSAERAAEVLQREDVQFVLWTDAIFVFGALVRLYYAWKTRGQVKAVDHDPLCPNRVAYTLTFCGCAAMLVCYNAYTVVGFDHADERFAWTEFPAGSVPVGVRYFGAALGLLSVCAFWYCHYSLGQSWSGYVALLENHQLVQTGFYRWVRHPMYTALLTESVALLLCSCSWMLALTWLSNVVLAASRIPKEERILAQHFGEQYTAYRQRTWALCPPFW